MHAKKKKPEAFLGMKMCFFFLAARQASFLRLIVSSSDHHPPCQTTTVSSKKTDRLSVQGAERPRRDKEGGGTSRSEGDKTCEIIYVQCERAAGGGGGRTAGRSEEQE